MSVFMIVGWNEPLYELQLKQQTEDIAHLNQFVLHSALDLIEEKKWEANHHQQQQIPMNLKVVDQFNDQLVSAFVTATSMKFLLLHTKRNEEGIRDFFHEVHSLYLKNLLNPFYEYDSPIDSSVFDARVKNLARRSRFQANTWIFFLYTMLLVRIKDLSEVRHISDKSTYSQFISLVKLPSFASNNFEGHIAQEPN